MTNTVVMAESPEATSVKSLILGHLEKIDKAKADLKNAREMMTNALENDSGYRAARECEKKERAARQVIEEKIKNDNPTPADKIVDLRDELKELQTALSEYLAEYVRLSGKMQIDRPDGTELRIVRKFKISPGQQKLF